MTLPGRTPVTIEYSSPSLLFDSREIDTNIITILSNYSTTPLSEYTNESYISSTLELTVLKDVIRNGTNLECFITNFSIEATVILINTSGMD